MNPTQAEIRRCPLDYICPQRWEHMEPVQAENAVLYCPRCERSVHLCHSEEDVRRHAALGRCLAIALPDKSFVVGEPRADQGIEASRHLDGRRVDCDRKIDPT